VAWADEIVVVDALGEDHTVKISLQFTDKVYRNPWPGFPAQRNFGLERTSGKWILILDADERMTPELRNEILACIAWADGEGVVAYRIPKRNYFFGRWMRWGGAFPDLQWRLFKRGSIRYDETTLDTPIVGGASAVMRNPIYHFTGRTIHQRLQKLEAETQVKARGIVARRWSDQLGRCDPQAPGRLPEGLSPQAGVSRWPPRVGLCRPWQLPHLRALRAGLGGAEKGRGVLMPSGGPAGGEMLSYAEVLYVAADGFVLSTLCDSFPNACLEAMAASLPIITSAQNGAL